MCECLLQDAITVTGENDEPAAAVRGKKDAADNDAAMYDEYLAAMDDDLTNVRCHLSPRWLTCAAGY